MRTIAILAAFTALMACQSRPTITPDQACQHLADAAVQLLYERNPALYATLREMALKGRIKTNECVAEFREALTR